jgi:hypothetical protein
MEIEVGLISILLLATIHGLYPGFIYQEFEMEIDINSVYKVSPDVFAREADDRLVIVPLVNGIGGEEEELFVLNATARMIWSRLDGKIKLKEVIQELAIEYNIPFETIAGQIAGFLGELLKRQIILQVK